MILGSFLADAGVPMIFLEMPAMIMALIPVILVETVIAKQMTNLSWKSSTYGVSLANIASTFVGVPLSWVLMLALDVLSTGGSSLGIRNPMQKFMAVTLQAAWLVPYEQHLYWMVPFAAITLLIPAFLISVWIERFICLRMWRDLDRAKVIKTVWMFNAVSYAILMLGVFIWIIFAMNASHVRSLL